MIKYQFKQFIAAFTTLDDNNKIVYYQFEIDLGVDNINCHDHLHQFLAENKKQCLEKRTNTPNQINFDVKKKIYQEFIS